PFPDPPLVRPRGPRPLRGRPSRSSLHPSRAQCRLTKNGEGPPLVERALAAVQHRFEPARRSVPVDVDHVDPHGPVGGQSPHHGPQRTRRAPRAADHAAEVTGVDPHLEKIPTAHRLRLHLDIVRVVDDATYEVLQGVGEHHSDASLDSAFSASSDGAASSAEASSPDSSAGFSASAFFSASALASAALALRSSASASAALMASWAASPLASLRFRVPSAPGSPLAACQSPVTFSRARTVSVGWAPTPTQ